MESTLRAALIEWLRSGPALAALNSVAEETPVAATPPWLGIAASASADWSTKDARGREIRVALELHCRGDDPATAATLVPPYLTIPLMDDILIPFQNGKQIDPLLVLMYLGG